MTDDPLPGYLDLYHRTSPEAAEAIMRSRSMNSKENTAEVYCSTRPDQQAEGYGQAVVQLRVPEEIAELEDEFPDGEQHYRVPVAALRPEHFITAWTDPQTGIETSREVHVSDEAGVAPAAARAAVPGRDLASSQAEPPTPDPGWAEVAPQVDLHLGEAVYRQREARHGGWTPEGVAAAQTAIEHAVTAQQPRPADAQRPGTAQRLHALADRVDTARAARTTAPPPAPPPPPSTAAGVARQRAVAAQIWNDTSLEHDPPVRVQRR